MGSSSRFEKTSSKRSLTKVEDGRDGAEVGGEGQDLPTGGLDEALGLFVDGDVGAAEAVDATAWGRRRRRACRASAHTAPVRGRLAVGVLGEEEGDLDLEGVGVLELVHQEVVEAPLEVAAHGDRVA